MGVEEAAAASSSVFGNIKNVLEGAVALPLYVQFLSRSNHADTLILSRSKDDTQRSLVCHGAIVISHGLMLAGTTNDTFLRENKEWLAKATNWAKFSACASLGVVHKVLISILPSHSAQCYPRDTRARA
jgi:26S proteasome regulatory subunit N2